MLRAVLLNNSMHEHVPKRLDARSIIYIMSQLNGENRRHSIVGFFFFRILIVFIHGIQIERVDQK